MSRCEEISIPSKTVQDYGFNELRGYLGNVCLKYAKRGATPITLPTGEEFRLLADADELIMHAWREADGVRPIRLCECRAVIKGARGRQKLLRVYGRLGRRYLDRTME